MASALEEDEIVGEWKKEKVLGAGGFGMVMLWRNLSTNQQVALKQIRWVNDPMMTPKHKQRWTQEVDIMKRLSHPNVVSAVDVPAVLDVRSDELPLLAMEYCSGGDLRKILTRPENCCGLSEHDLRKILQHVSSALGYLHARRIIHRDLKPENIVLQETDGKIVYKLIDLGYAKELDQGSLCTSFVGTLQYLAPELFMTQKYTSTVDYWSLGLVTHECITGLRPFLPNWSPAQWIPHVMKKNSEHICAYQEPDGNVKFSSQLFPENHISNQLKKLIENWLAVMLEWDPQNRGCIFEDGKKKVIAFEMLESILSKKILTVFCIQACKFLWYEISENTTMGQVVQWAAADMQEPKTNFLFLLQQGSPFDMKKEALSYCPELDDEEWVLYAFHNETVEIPKFNPNIPPMVERMFREPKESTVYETQRKMWAYSVYFISKERRLYGCLLQAQKVVMMYLLTRNSVIYNLNTRMVKELSKLKAKLELFEESLQCDVQKYENQAQNGGITSNIMFRNWLASREISKKIAVLTEKVFEMEGKATVVNTKTIELQRSPFARNKTPQVLQEVYEKALAAFETLRNRPKEHRRAPSNNSEMLTLVLTCVKHRERLHRDVYVHIQKLTNCINDVQQLLDPMEAIQAEIGEHKKQLEVIQKERQIDIWKLIENLCKKLRAVKTGAKSGPSSCTNCSSMEQESSLAASVTSESSCKLSQSTLSSIVDKSIQETPSLSNENALLRTRLKGLQENFNLIQGDAVSLPDILDWNL